MINSEPMVGKEAAKALIISDRLNELSIDANSNLKCINEINNVLLGETNLSERSKEESKQPRQSGWFSNVIDILITLHNANIETKRELVRLHKEVIDK